MNVNFNLFGGCKFVLAFPDGAVVLAHAGLGSASEVGLATTRDQPMEGRWLVRPTPCIFLFFRHVGVRTRSSSFATSTGASKVLVVSVSKYFFLYMVKT